MLSPVRVASRDRVVSPPSSAMVSSSVIARSTDWMLARSGAARGRPSAASIIVSTASAIAQAPLHPPPPPLACLFDWRGKKTAAPTESRHFLDRERRLSPHLKKPVTKNLNGTKLGQKAAAPIFELGRLASHLVGGGDHHLGRRPGLIGLAAHHRDGIRHVVGAPRRDRDVRRDLVGRGLLLLDRDRDRRRHLVDLAHGRAD